MADRLAALGGELDVRSRPGTGTTVFGSIPIVEATNEAEPGDASAVVKRTAVAPADSS